MALDDADDAASTAFGAADARQALVDLLNAFQNPKNLERLETARAEAGNDMTKQMQIVFPVVSAIQSDVVARFGFSADGEGVVQFIQHVKAIERQDPEVRRLHKLVRAYFIPPLIT